MGIPGQSAALDVNEGNCWKNSHKTQQTRHETNDTESVEAAAGAAVRNLPTS